MTKRTIEDFGFRIGSMPKGKRNAISDVPGVTVGHSTIDTREHKTGVTVIMPCPDNMFQNKLTASVHILNGFGKSLGTVQVQELGTLESPIALTNTLNVGLVHDALVSYMVTRCEREEIPLFSYNPVVGECNDCHLNHIRERAVKEEHVLEAILTASADFEQGDVGAGKGTICYGLKGGIGSASRIMRLGDTEYHLGILVQSNFGRTEDLTIAGQEIGKELISRIKPSETDKGSIISVLATDLPLSSRQIHRVLKRLGIGLGRTGSHVGNGSGDIMIGFTTANRIPDKKTPDDPFVPVQILQENLMDTVFRAAIEAEEEAVLNSLAAADAVTGYQGYQVHALSELL